MASLCLHRRPVFIPKINSPFPALVGSLQVTMYEKSCAVPSQCGVSGQKYASGLYFNYTNVCCDTDLCNGAASVAALSWGGVALSLLPALTLLLAWASEVLMGWRSRWGLTTRAEHQDGSDLEKMHPHGDMSTCNRVWKFLVLMKNYRGWYEWCAEAHIIWYFATQCLSFLKRSKNKTNNLKILRNI